MTDEKQPLSLQEKAQNEASAVSLPLILDPGDGYTLEGKLASRPGVHGEMNYKYRPALADEVQKFFSALAKNPDGAVGTRAAFLAKHLVEWDGQTPGGTPAAIEVNVIRRLRHSALVELCDVVCGYASSGQEAADAGN
jgi:hypothetical protein